MMSRKVETTTMFVQIQWVTQPPARLSTQLPYMRTIFRRSVGLYRRAESVTGSDVWPTTWPLKRTMIIVSRGVMSSTKEVFVAARGSGKWRIVRLVLFWDPSPQNCFRKSQEGKTSTSRWREFRAWQRLHQWAGGDVIVLGALILGRDTSIDTRMDP